MAMSNAALSEHEPLMCTRLLELPDDALNHLLGYLDASELCTFAQCSHQARLLADQELLWERLCSKFSIDTQAWRALPFKKLYSAIFHKYGHLIGTWYSPDRPYGAIVKLQPCPPCSLDARFLVLCDCKRPLYWKPLFQIAASADTPAAVITCARQAGPTMLPMHFGASHCHAASLQLSPTPAGPCLALSCSQHCQHFTFEILSRHLWAYQGVPQPQDLPEEAVSAAPAEEAGVPDALPPAAAATSLALMSAQHYAGRFYEGAQPPRDPRCMRLLPLAAPGSRHPLEGLWRGTYGAHGLEVVRVELLGGRWLTGTKVTGDFNVPAGEVTFRADTAAAAGAAAEAPAGPADGSRSSAAAAERFQLPAGFQARVDWRQGAHELWVQARLPAEGHIAHAGFEDDGWTGAELVEFSSCCFALLWSELRSCALFTRLPL